MTKHKYTKELIQEAVINSTSVAGVLRYLEMPLAGGNHSNITRRIKDFGINTDHFTGQGHTKGKQSNNRKSADEILIVRPVGAIRESAKRLRRALSESGIAYECNRSCGVDMIWNGKPITLEVNHIDGDWLNNLLENLEFLCPNCHSQETSSNMPHKYRSSATLK